VAEPIELRVDGGRTLVLGARFDEAALVRVIRVLETL